MKIKRGDIVIANLEPVKGSEQGRVRPVLILQNNIINENSPTTIVAPLTTKIYDKEYPTNVEVYSSDTKLKNKSTILLNQIRTIDKSRIISKVSSLNEYSMHKVDIAIMVCLSLN